MTSCSKKSPLLYTLIKKPTVPPLLNTPAQKPDYWRPRPNDTIELKQSEYHFWPFRGVIGEVICKPLFAALSKQRRSANRKINFADPPAPFDALEAELTPVNSSWTIMHWHVVHSATLVALRPLLGCLHSSFARNV